MHVSRNIETTAVNSESLQSTKNCRIALTAACMCGHRIGSTPFELATTRLATLYANCHGVFAFVTSNDR